MSLPADSRWPLVESLNFVWDINLLDWVPETQPGGSGPTGTVDQGVGGVSAWLVTADTWPLPTGASTGLKQDTGNTSLASIDGKLTSPLTVQATNLDIRDLTFASDKVDASGSAVTVASLPLPSGAATALRQDTGNTSLASIDTKLTSPLTVQATDLDIRNLVFATDKVDVSGSALTAVVTATDLDIRNLAFATDKVDASGSALTAVVTATDLDIRNLAFATDKVDVTGSSVTASVTGTVTANAGTNLNTSLLALEAGGNLATVATNTTALVAKDFATETTLALAAAYLLALNTAQGAASDGVVGPLVQSLVNDSPLSLLQGTVQPLSLTAEGRLRVSSADSYLDKIWQHTFEDVWGTSLTTVANSDLPFAGEVRYV